jgi:hypothetical protein
MTNKIIIDRKIFMEEYELAKSQYEEANDAWKDLRIPPKHVDHLNILAMRYSFLDWFLSLDESQKLVDNTPEGL